MKHCLIKAIIVVGIISCMGTACRHNATVVNNDEKLLPLDSTGRWLAVDKNYGTPQYGKVFSAAFQQQLKNNEPDSTILLLLAYGHTCDYLEAYDSTYLYTALSFYQHYQNKVQAPYLHELEYYISSLYGNNYKTDSSNYWAEKVVTAPADGYRQKQIKALALFVQAYNSQVLLQYVDAEHKYLASLKLAEEIGDLYTESSVYITMSTLYEQSYSYNDEAGVLDKGIAAAKQLKDSHFVFIGYTYYISLKKYLGDTLGALRFTDSLNSIYFATRPSDISSIQWFNLYNAYKYIMLKRQDSAQYFIQQYIYNSKQGSQGRTYPNIMDYKTAVLSVMFANSFGTSLQNPDKLDTIIALKKKNDKDLWFVAGIQSWLSDYYFKRHDYEKAFRYQSDWIATFRRLMDFEKRGQFFELDKKYESEKKDKQLLQHENAIAAKQHTIWILLTSLIILVLSIIIYYLLQRKNKLDEQKKRSHIYTQQLLAKTEEERKRIASDLHDSIGNELISLKNQPWEE